MKTRITTYISSIALMTCTALGQGFTSGSDGSDGALVIPADQGETEFDPGSWGFDGDHIYHFTTIDIGANTTLRIGAQQANGPIFWLATGDVNIQGVIDLDGRPGQSLLEIRSNGDVRPAEAGAGGYHGGVGKTIGDGTSFSTPGGGPGGGAVQTDTRGLPGSSDYLNNFLVPLIGGSGGAGGDSAGSNVQASGGGGAGGGAILIASSTQITLSAPGGIYARGGNAGGGYATPGHGGSGSGGAIRLAAPAISGNGTLAAHGGSGAGSGIIRIEAHTRGLSGSQNPQAVYGAPYNTFLPSESPPFIAVTSVGGVAIDNPMASFVVPDAVVNSAVPVDVVIETENVPLSATITLYVFPVDGAQQQHNVTSLTGNLGSASATQAVTLPAGHSRGFVTATWAP